jgi:hypothetical protein
MDFPLFHLDFIGNRMVIATIAIVHVLINHSMAVGAMPLITLMEWYGYRTSDPRWDRLAYRLLAVCFIITTTVGAMTGVGIWLSASLVNPAAIGSLIRVFFWGWFTEWIIFVIEVSLILAYFLTWNNWGRRNKVGHIGVGLALSIFSWLTMAIIVAILGFMMDSGQWPVSQNFLRGVLNPIYLPQLMFRTPAAMVMAGVFCLFLSYFFTKRGDVFRKYAIRFAAGWTFVWTLPLLAGSWSYWMVIPDWMRANVPVALGTQAFEHWHDHLATIILVSAAVLPLIALWGMIKPTWLPRVALVVPFVLAIALMGYFERVREFIRKPDVIENYMYANGIRHADYPLLQEEGLLKHAPYVAHRQITDANRVQVGCDVFNIACTRCHTTTGVNGIVSKLTGLYGTGEWSHEAISGYIGNMHNVRIFMPPFPGNQAELGALTSYLIALREGGVPDLDGAQERGIVLPVTVRQSESAQSAVNAEEAASAG